MTTTEQGTATLALAPVNAAVAMLDDADFAGVINVLGIIAECKRGLAELQKLAEAVAVERLEAIGPQVIGSIRYYAGVSKTTKPRDLREAVEAIMHASGGEWPRFVDCLSSNALKTGECRKLFAEAGSPELFDVVFETVEKAELKEGKAPKELQTINLAFVK